MTEARTGGNARRMCLLADGRTAHGPIVEIDKDGKEHLVGRVVRGKREGRFVEPGLGGITSETTYRDGLVDGTFTLKRANGTLIGEQAFVRGQRHGARREWSDKGALVAVELYDRGVPVGEWLRDGSKRV